MHGTSRCVEEVTSDGTATRTQRCADLRGDACGVEVLAKTVCLGGCIVKVFIFIEDKEIRVQEKILSSAISAWFMKHIYYEREKERGG